MEQRPICILVLSGLLLSKVTFGRSHSTRKKRIWKGIFMSWDQNTKQKVEMCQGQKKFTHFYMSRNKLILEHHLSCISASQEYQQTRRPLQKKICIKNANSFGGNCFSNDKISETSHFTVFSLPLYSFPIVHFFTVTEEKTNFCFICLSLWGVEN